MKLFLRVVHSQRHSDHNVYVVYRSKQYCHIDQVQLVTYVLKYNCNNLSMFNVVDFQKIFFKIEVHFDFAKYS
jgi:hypothetical protein